MQYKSFFIKEKNYFQIESKKLFWLMSCTISFLTFKNNFQIVQFKNPEITKL